MKQLNITNSITRRDSDSLTWYLKEIRKTKFLTPEEEFVLIKKIRRGDLQALESLVGANLRFVVAVAKYYQNHGISLSDLISEGNLGLLKAAQRYDETRGFKFISYAVWWIRQSILQAICEYSRFVRLPRNKLNSINKISKAFVKLEQEFEREPTHEELAHLLEADSHTVKKYLGMVTKQVSIDAPVSKDKVQSLGEILENPNAELPDRHVSYNESLKNEIESMLSGLKGNQAEVVKMYYGIGGWEQMTLYDISKKINVSKERVRQIKEQAILTIKNSGQYNSLKEFVGA